jgi:RimJ/RimL family protein N-acetyltransferase
MIKYSKQNNCIETERLILRQPEMKDISDVIRNISNLEVTKWLLVVPYPYTEKDAVWYINHCKEKLDKNPREDYSYWIELKETKEVIGGIGLAKVSMEHGTGSVGYWLGVDHHRKGYGSEALEALLDLAFNKLSLRRLEAGVFVGNPSSGKLLEKYGFKLEGTKRQAVVSKASGEIMDENLYGLLKSEHKK